MLKQAYEITEKKFEDEIINYYQQKENLFLLLDISLITDLNVLPTLPKDIVKIFKNSPYEKFSNDSPLLFNISQNSDWLK